jgi:biopolymer transport protein TolR
MGAAGTEVSGDGRRRKRRSSYVPMSEINVTPFVDVMLVLLIVFMVTAPLLTVGVPIELPETRANPIQGDSEPLTVSVAPNGMIYLQETEIDLDTLAPKLVAIAREGYDQRIFVRGDRSVDYGNVMKVMGVLNRAGFRRIALVTETVPVGEQ